MNQEGEVMKANYENWVPKGMATGFAAGAAALRGILETHTA